jgi:hypothetical protein
MPPLANVKFLQRRIQVVEVESFLASGVAAYCTAASRLFNESLLHGSSPLRDGF